MSYTSDLEKHIIWGEFVSEANKAMDTLSESERFVIAHRIGLNDCEILPITEIGRRLSLSPSKTRSFYHRAIGRIFHKIPVFDYEEFVP